MQFLIPAMKPPTKYRALMGHCSEARQDLEADLFFGSWRAVSMVYLSVYLSAFLSVYLTMALGNRPQLGTDRRNFRRPNGFFLPPQDGILELGILLHGNPFWCCFGTSKYR